MALAHLYATLEHIHDLGRAAGYGKEADVLSGISGSQTQRIISRIRRIDRIYEQRAETADSRATMGSAVDALLARLGARLAQAVGDRGTAYRMGGDEFCVLAGVGSRSVATVRSRRRRAFLQDGAGARVPAGRPLDLDRER